MNALVARLVVAAQLPCFTAFRELRALPADVRAPVDRVHGCHPLISSACRLRRSGVQPFMVTFSNSSFV